MASIDFSTRRALRWPSWRNAPRCIVRRDRELMEHKAEVWILQFIVWLRTVRLSCSSMLFIRVRVCCSTVLFEYKVEQQRSTKLFIGRPTIEGVNQWNPLERIQWNQCNFQFFPIFHHFIKRKAYFNLSACCTHPKHTDCWRYTLQSLHCGDQANSSRPPSFEDQ